VKRDVIAKCHGRLLCTLIDMCCDSTLKYFRCKRRLCTVWYQSLYVF